MRKFAANYVVSEAGEFLKNGIIVANESGFVTKYIDTKGDLRETEQLIFYNGIIVAGHSFVKTEALVSASANDQPFYLQVIQAIAGSAQVSIQSLFDLGNQVQVMFPEMKIPEILNEITAVLLDNCGFTKKTTSGIYLVTGTNLVELRFTRKCRLKKIL